jgi:hypothetical protein
VVVDGHELRAPSERGEKVGGGLERDENDDGNVGG